MKIIKDFKYSLKKDSNFRDLYHAVVKFILYAAMIIGYATLIVKFMLWIGGK